ncbi:MbtH family NRPS accessory protein [Streptomyces sp. NPDC006184]|uniref:MbtH family protein n=1 Tax=Streptomyces sp. NPDC006184 TaxID=3155455 RepID=UPI0033A4312E
MAEEDIDERAYRVVLDDEEQYSVWHPDRELPRGRHAEGTEGRAGTRAGCPAHIGTVWTDLRPLGLRRQMERAARG